MYTTNEKYTDIDKIRTRLRTNEYDHKNFEPALRSPDGDIYFKEAYSTAYNNEELKEKGQ